MPNGFKYNTSPESLSLKEGNFYMSTNDVGRGPTSTTGFYNGITPTRGGYTIYLNKASGGASIYVASNDNDLIFYTNKIASTNYTTVNECFNYYSGQSDKVVVNRDYSSINTDGLLLNLDASFTPSYPRNGTTWYDISSYGYNGTLVNGPTYSSNYDGTISFDGSDDNVTISNDITSNFSTNGITVEAWVYHNNFTGSQAYINNWFNFTSPQRGFILRTFNGQTYPSFWWCWGSVSSTNSYSTVYASNTPFSANTWYHVVGVYEKNVSARIYVNGVLKGTNSSVPYDIVYDTTNGVSVGTSNINTSRMNGNISEARIYNRVLSSSEILQNFRSSGPQSFSSCKTCKEIIDTYPQLAGYDGLYWVYPSGSTSTPYQVYCDMTTDGGGWMMVARSHPTTVNYGGKNWGWKGGSIGNINDFSQAYQLGWGEIWDGNTTFTSYIYGNQRTNADNSWGPFVYKVSSIDYSTFFGSDTLQSYTKSTLKSDTSVYGTTAYPSMQQAIGFTTTGTINNRYFMRDCCGYSNYGGIPTRMDTTYCGRVISYNSGPWCGGSTTTGGVYDYNTYITSGYTYGGTNQYMIMVK
jgi:hypothetical protein